MNIIVMGASSGFGAALINEALNQNITVHAVTRNPRAIISAHAEHVKLSASHIDPMDMASLAACYAGADAVAFALNVSYEQWDPFMVDALKATLSALKSMSTAPRLVFPGNVYALDPKIEGLISELEPNKPSTNKGRLRAEMEKLLDGAAKTGLSITNIRMADFFGPTVRNRMIDGIFDNVRQQKPIELLGAGRSTHQFSYIPDAARIALHLLSTPTEAGVQIVNAPTHTVASLSEFAVDVARQAGQPDLKIRKMPWFFLSIVGLFSALIKEVVELRYLFDDGIMLSDDKLARLFPSFEATPIERAISDTLSSY